ncbi:hypothetical protein AOL_s00088g47 [Orbilia oligospora ATCC 24927]|uniref:Uncharacterized protein n=1 Tax=Arthrobotrys oligospora (strain ATCC 24927 / CBS 115.81 / DSM 1491) TaxID=756982 RepID=G1XHT4_ARTOA|nr:hypothetical protein AOL_s00088g47 [Orbilia oligospora ATCC 24927]EGX47332.1 hypothetical protein AOL_s00088g47 [Orbilia oligospora ATCC 24927]
MEPLLCPNAAQEAGMEPNPLPSTTNPKSEKRVLAACDGPSNDPDSSTILDEGLDNANSNSLIPTSCDDPSLYPAPPIGGGGHTSTRSEKSYYVTLAGNATPNSSNPVYSDSAFSNEEHAALPPPSDRKCTPECDKD